MHFLPFKLKILPRELVFKQPAGTSRGVYTTRKVWYIVLTSTDPQIRFTGLGECAPLYDLSCDYDEHYEERLHQICQEVEQTQILIPKSYVLTLPFSLDCNLLSARLQDL